MLDLRKKYLTIRTNLLAKPINILFAYFKIFRDKLDRIPIDHINLRIFKLTDPNYSYPYNIL